jgi:type II secretory pathway component PulF
MQIASQPWLQEAILILTIICSLMVVRLMASSTRGLFISRRVPSVFRVVADRLIWYTPLIGRAAEAQSTAAACEALSLALAAGRTANEAVAIANLPSLNVVLGQRLRHWGGRISEGAPLAAAARESKMPRLLTELLTSARDDAAGAVAFAARAYDATSERYLLLLRALLPLCFTTLFAAGTLLIALALFQPMITLMEALDRSFFK